MITQLYNVPANMVAFDATGDVTKDDYERVVIPAIKQAVEKTGELNYLMVVDTPLKNFSTGAWMEDLLVGIKQIGKMRRCAILTSSEGLNKFTNLVGHILPGQYKGFPPEDFSAAVEWVSAA